MRLVAKEVSPIRTGVLRRLAPAWGAFLALAASPAAAEVPAAQEPPRAAVEWLMREPVTLFDLGIIQLRQDLRRLAVSLSEAGHTASVPLAGAFYDWRTLSIIAYLTLPEGAAPATGDACRALFGQAQRELFKGLPAGPRRAATYLENLFLHEGPGNIGRPQNLGEQLVAAVRFEVTLLAQPRSGDRQGIRCSGGLDAEPAEIIVSVPGSAALRPGLGPGESLN
jgi:hypothetical protein